ncbi:OmpH family outer membrane protein [candidate division KSB1 bacterium]|nr:OmpH family outer membrane protein [candidate division KSB1 bacterium]
MKTLMTWAGALLAVVILGNANPVAAQLKLGYIDSQKILEKYKEAQDAQKQLQDLNRRWEEEAKNMQQELQTKLEELESQALLLSDERKKEKETELQNLNIRLNQFQQEKWGNQGEVFTKRAELMQPVINKINDVIKKIGTDDKYDYIFDVVNGNILHVSASQPDLTEKVLEELNKSVAAAKPASTTTTPKAPASTKPKN